MAEQMIHGEPLDRKVEDIITHQPLFNEDGQELGGIILVTRTQVETELHEDGRRQILRVLGTESAIMQLPGKLTP